MKKNLRNRNFTSVKNHLLPADCIELTEAELFLVNGGREVENSNAGVANAQVGDTVTRNDNTTVTITQGDIDWAKAHCEGGGSNSNSGENDGGTQEMTASGAENPPGQNSGSIAYQPQGSQSDGISTGATNNSYNGYSLSPNTPSFFTADMGYYRDAMEGCDSPDTIACGNREIKPKDTNNYYVDYKNGVVQVDINSKESYENAFKALMINDMNSNYKFHLQLMDGKNVIHTFSDTASAARYVNEVGVFSDLRKNERNVKTFVAKIKQKPDNYFIDAYQRKALFPYHGKRNGLLTHSLYVITDKKTGEKSTLSFNGAGPIGLISEGAWGLNTETDVKGWNNYVNGNNNYDMTLYRSSEGIDVQKTALNIITSINSSTSYMAVDHKWDWHNWENCNTALYNTIEKKH